MSKHQVPNGKIFYGNPDLSAFLVSTLSHGLQVNTQVPLKQEKTAHKLQALNTKLVLGDPQKDPTFVYGELSICDYLASVANVKAQNVEIGTTFTRIGESTKFDQYLHKLNNGLRISMTKFVIEKDQSASDQIKEQAKELESLGLLEDLKSNTYGSFGILHAMFYCYLEPAEKLVNKNFKAALDTIKKSVTIQSFSAFQKGEKLDQADGAPAQGKLINYAKEAILNRLNKGQKILPVKNGKRNILITSALPYVNNVPHLGNIIGCVLSADVYARYVRLAGHNAIFICGTDEYGTATETKAMEEKKTCKEICDHYNAIHSEIYEWFQCDFDYFGRTTTPIHEKITGEIFLALREKGNTKEKFVDQHYCKNCGKFLADRLVEGKCPLIINGEQCLGDAQGDQCDKCSNMQNAIDLIDPRCKVCKATPEIRSSENIFIDLPKITPDLEKWVNHQKVAGKWSTNAIAFCDRQLRDGLIERSISRDLKWGSKIPIDRFTQAGKVFYVWFDAPIGYISITANYLGAENDDWKQWWQNPDNVELYQFMGKDNTTFHTVIFPSTLIGSGQPWTMLKTVSTTEWLMYEKGPDGKPGPFSKRNGTGVFGNDAQQTGIPVEVWRYYLLSTRPESSDSTFEWKSLVDRNNGELSDNLGNMTYRVLSFLKKKDRFDGVVPEYKGDLHQDDKIFIQSQYKLFQEYVELMEDVKIKEALQLVMKYSSACNGYLQHTKFFDLFKSDRNRCEQVMNTMFQIIRVLSCLLEPFCPSFSAKVYQQMNLTRTQADEILIQTLRDGGELAVRNLIPSGHKIGDPAPIIKQYTDDDVEKWKAQFGNQKK